MYINLKIAKYTLQKIKKIHFFSKIFGHIKKKQYLCTVKQKNVKLLKI